MVSDKHPGADWIQAWIAAQKATVESLSDGRIPSSVGDIDAATDFFRKLVGGASAAPHAPGDSLATMWRAFGFPPSIGSSLAAEAPGVGPLRELQASVTSLAAALADHQRLLAEWSAVMARVQTDTLDLLARRTAEQANSGTPVLTFKALYDLWVECGEATYARVVEGDAYCRLQSDLSNAGLRVRGLEQHLVERWLKQLDLPTRAELNTLHRRVRDLQRELALLKAEKLVPVPTPASTKRPPARKPPAKTARAALKPRKGAG